MMDEGNGPDWAAIRRAVEDGKEAQVEIAARFGVKPQHIYARKHRWAWEMKVDTASAAGIERGVSKMIRQIFTQLRGVAAQSRMMSRQARIQADLPADDATLRRRLAQAAEAEARLSSIMKLTAEFTKLLDRAARLSAAERAAEDEYRESHEQFESRLLGYVERARAEMVCETAEPAGPSQVEP